MSDELPGEPGQESGQGGVWSDLSGTARDVVQAGHVHGGVHFHGPASVRVEVPVPRQLPGDVPDFTGRAAELARAQALLTGDERPDDAASVLVIVGTAGVGKTSLAIRLAHRISARFPGGQLFVNLHGYDTGPPLAPQAVLERFLRALGVPPPAIPAGVEERAELYRSLLAGRRMLVVLDNAASAGQVRPLLPGAPGCLTVVTSRHRLSGLAVRDGARRITLGMLTESESAELITTATRGYRTGDDPAHVTELARLCARLPLALRIAAERAATRPLLPLPELIANLRDESTLWDALSDPDDEEADAVRTVFAWSYRTLPPPAARPASYPPLSLPTPRILATPDASASTYPQNYHHHAPTPPPPPPRAPAGRTRPPPPPPPPGRPPLPPARAAPRTRLLRPGRRRPGR
nr:ATP-binding protein [Streptomyces specialis]